MKKPPEHAVSVNIEVPFHDVDALNIVWHGHYLKYFEIARTFLMRGRGLDVANVSELGFRQFVIESHIRHSFPLHYGDQFRVYAWLGELNHKIKIEFLIWNLTHDRRCARGSTVLVTTDANGTLLMETPKAIRRCLTPILPLEKYNSVRSPSAMNVLAIAALCCILVAIVATTVVFADEPIEFKDELTVDGLLAAFRKAPGIEAHYVEMRQIALLSLPLESKGVIYFAPPGILARHQTSPASSFQIIEPDRVRFGSDSHSETVELVDKPDVKAFIDSFVTLISGDIATLHKLYTVDFQAADPLLDDRWKLTLQPRLDPVSKVIALITLTGTGLVLSTMHIVETEGDETITTFSNVDVMRTFTADERNRIFLLSGTHP